MDKIKKFLNTINKVVCWYSITLVEAHEFGVLFLIIFGVYVFETHQINGQPYFKHRRKRILPIISIGGMFSIIFYSLHIKIKSLDPTDFISYYSVISLYCFNVFVTFLTVIIFNCKSKYYVMLCCKCIDLNNKMRSTGLNVEYKLVFYLVIGHVFLFIVIILSAFYMGYLVDIFALLYPYGVRLGIIVICCANYSFFARQFVLIKQYSKSNINHFQDPNVSDYYCNVLIDNVNEFYETVVYLTTSLVKVYELIIFLNLSANTIEIVACVILLYIEGINGLILTMCLLYALGNIIYFQLYYHADKTTKTAEDVAVSIGLLSVFDMNHVVATKKNTFLFLCLSNKLTNKLFGVVSLNFSILITQIEICKTLLILLMQYLAKKDIT